MQPRRQWTRKAEELLNAITALRMIPNKDALKDLIGKAEAVNTSKYTAKERGSDAEGIEQRKGCVEQ